MYATCGHAGCLGYRGASRVQWPVEKGQGCYRRRLCKAILG